MANKKLEYREAFPVEQIKGYTKNPRRMPAQEMEALKASIEKFGFVQPILLRKEDNVIVAGHQRLDAVSQLGMESVPVNLISLTDEEYKVLNINLNKIGGGWDSSKLMDMLDSIVADGVFPLELTGFTQDYLDQMHENASSGGVGELIEPDDGMGLVEEPEQRLDGELCPTCGRPNASRKRRK